VRRGRRGATVQEDIDILGISILSGTHDTLGQKIVERARGYPILVGGIIPEENRD